MLTVGLVVAAARRPKSIAEKSGIRNVAFVTKSTIRQARVLPEVNCRPS